MAAIEFVVAETLFSKAFVPMLIRWYMLLMVESRLFLVFSCFGIFVCNTFFAGVDLFFV